jgi:adenosine deaminase CECR1
LRLYNKYPNLISGFDMVSEEDKGYSLLFYLEDFAKLAAQNISLPYFFHTAETNWPDDLLTSIHADDPVATMENIYDAIILGAKRVGHGIGYLNHPYLMEILKKRKIAVEANPVSNQMLGYVPDQRHHPAITYLRYGMPVVLGADDPATFGYNEFTLDWYEAFMAWGLNLGDLRHLAMNSLQYSSLSASEKITAMAKWKIAWDIFITETKSKACMHTFQNLTPSVHRIFPKEGHINGDTKIRVFGRNFQVAVCKTIICRFGSELTYGTFVYEHMLICNSPKRTPQTLQTPINPLHVPLSLSLDNGATFQETGIVFSYLHANVSHHFTGTDIFGK